MKRIDVYFLALAGLSLLGGVSLGIFMAASKDYQLMPVHAHLNLVGWASLALFGLVYRAYPELASRSLAKVHLLLSAAAALLLPPGIAMAVLYQAETLAVTSSLLWLAAVIVFLIQIVSLFGPQDATR